MLENELLAKSRPWDIDESDKPDEVVVGEDGRYYFANPAYTPGFGWSTSPNYDEPAYYFTSSNELGDVNNERFEEDEWGNIVSVDAGFQREAGSWLSRAEIEQRWNADQGMGFFKEAHPDMTFDDYMSFLDEASMLQASGLERTSYTNVDGEVVEGLNPAYLELYAKYGIKDRWTNGDGDEFRFNGGSFTKTHKVDDSLDAGALLAAIAVSALTAGVATAVAPALAGALGVSTTTAKALVSAAIGLAKDGEVSLEDALGIAIGDAGGALGLAGEMGNVTQDAIDAAIDAATGEILNPDNYRQTETGEIVWDQHDGKVISGVVDENGNYKFDPATIQVIYPDYSFDSEDDGGGGGEDSSSDTDSSSSSSSSSTDSTDSTNDPNDPNNSNTSNTAGRYEVIGRTADGKWVVRDNDVSGDGDIWIVEGDFQEGQIITEDDMVNGNATVGSESDIATDTRTDPVGWVWDAVNEVWNPVFRDTELDPDDIVAPTSEKPTKPPVTDTGTSTSGSSTVTGNTPDGWTPDNSSINDNGGDDQTGTSDTSGDGVGTVEGNLPDGWNPDNGNIKDGGGDDGGTKGTKGDGDDGDGDDGDGDDGTGDGPDGDGWDDGDDGDKPGTPQPTAGGLFNPEWSPLDWSRPNFEMATPPTLTPYESIINSLKRDKGMLS